MAITNQQKHDEDESIIDKWIKNQKILGIKVEVVFAGNIKNYNDSYWKVTEYESTSHHIKIILPKLKYTVILLSNGHFYNYFKSMCHKNDIEIYIDYSYQSLGSLNLSQIKINSRYYDLRNDIYSINAFISFAMDYDFFKIKIDINTLIQPLESGLENSPTEKDKIVLLKIWILLKINGDLLAILDSKTNNIMNKRKACFREQRKLISRIYDPLCNASEKIDELKKNKNGTIQTTRDNTEYIENLIQNLFKTFQGNIVKIQNGNLESDKNILSRTEEIIKSLEDIINGIIIREKH